MQPSLAAAERFITLHAQYLRDPQSVLQEYKALDLQFALLNWSVGSVKAYIRKEQEKCNSAHAQ